MSGLGSGSDPVRIPMRELIIGLCENLTKIDSDSMSGWPPWGEGGEAMSGGTATKFSEINSSLNTPNRSTLLSSNPMPDFNHPPFTRSRHWYQCPECELVGTITNSQYHGTYPISCPECGHTVTVDLSHSTDEDVIRP